MNKKKSGTQGKISAEALRQFADNRRIANKAVQKAIEENRKAGIPDDLLYAQ